MTKNQLVIRYIYSDLLPLVSIFKQINSMDGPPGGETLTRRARTPTSPFLWVLPIVAAFALPGCATIEVDDSEAGLAIEDFLSEEEESRLKILTGEPMVEEIRFDSAGQSYNATLYVPADEVRAGIVIVPGHHRKGRHHERLVRLGNTFARLGFIVLVPELPGLRELQTRARNVSDGCSLSIFSNHTLSCHRPRLSALGESATAPVR